MDKSRRVGMNWFEKIESKVALETGKNWRVSSFPRKTLKRRERYPEQVKDMCYCWKVYISRSLPLDILNLLFFRFIYSVYIFSVHSQCPSKCCHKDNKKSIQLTFCFSYISNQFTIRACVSRTTAPLNTMITEILLLIPAFRLLQTLVQSCITYHLHPLKYCLIYRCFVFPFLECVREFSQFEDVMRQ